jgi:methyl-accepting chemotaxis protein
VSIKTQLVIALSFLTLLFAVTTGITWTETRRIQSDVAGIDEAVRGLTTDQLNLIRLTKEIQINVIQVQQWLTGISATRALDGLADGFDEAAEQAQQFDRNIASARTLAEACGLTDLAERLDRTRDAFGPYYDIGRKMAQAYIDLGPAGGNPMMAQFDEGSVRIQDALGELVEATTAAVANSTETMFGSVHEIVLGASRLSVIVMILGVAGIVGVLAIGLLARIKLVAALSQFTATVLRVADGALDTTIPFAGRRDEIGALSRAVAVFRDTMIENQKMQDEQRRAQQQRIEDERVAREREQNRLEAEQAEKTAREKRMAAERRQAMMALADGLENSVGGVISAVVLSVEQLRNSSASLASSANDTTRQSASVAAVAERASTDVDTVAESAGKLDASINEIARQTSKSAEKARAAVAHARKTNSRVDALADAASKIGDVVGLIAQIASQTNLLALNATIEAARAGDAGKGFAVVATEVKLLADQTAKATDEITRGVEAIQSGTREAILAMEEINQAIGEIDEIGGRVTEAIERQGIETGAIARSAQQVSSGTAEVTRHIAGVAKAAQVTDEASGQVGKAAENLGTQSGALHEAVDAFLAQIRAA